MVNVITFLRDIQCKIIPNMEQTIFLLLQSVAVTFVTGIYKTEYNLLHILTPVTFFLKKNTVCVISFLRVIQYIFFFVYLWFKNNLYEIETNISLPISLYALHNDYNIFIIILNNVLYLQTYSCCLSYYNYVTLFTQNIFYI
jgi:hypothetical protein